MITTPQQSLDACMHERRPGTTVCLHCRHAARIVARERRNRLMLRGAAVAIICATFLGAGVVSATAIRSINRRDAARVAPVDQKIATVAVPPAASGDSPGAPSSRMVQQGQALDSSVAPLTPVVPIGESPLGDGVTAIRADSVVTVAFDTPLARTRLPEKFEQFVRLTLPQIYGPSVDGVLAKLPVGAIANQGSLLYDLPVRGARIPIADSWAIRVYPETRPGQDGPLVVRYSVSVVSKNE